MQADLKFVDPVVQTLMSVFTSMIQLEPRAGEIQAKDDDIARGDVTGMIKVVGEQANGTVSISFSKPVVLDLVKRMLHMEIEEIDEIARDLAGEMANIVVGGAKNLLEEQGYKLEISLPEIMAGEGHKIEHSFHGETIAIPFTVDSGDIFVEVNFTEAA